MFELLQYIDVAFMLCVLFGTEAWKKYTPLRWHSKYQTLIVTIFVGAIFWHFNHFQNGDDYEYTIKLTTTFLCAIGCYDYVYKPLKDVVTKFGKQDS